MNSDTKTKAQPQDSEETEAETDKARFEKDYILETGSVLRTKGRHAIHCLTVIGPIEGHSIAPQTQKTTKYEHVIPQLVSIEEDPEVEGLLVILNTVGGDVEAGLAQGRTKACSRNGSNCTRGAFGGTMYKYQCAKMRKSHACGA